MSVRQRVLDMQAVIAEHHEHPRLGYVAIVCNGCGRHASVQTADLSVVDMVFADWLIAESEPWHDYCPTCRTR